MFPKFNKRQFANIVTGDETKYGLLNTIQNLKLDYGGKQHKSF